MISDIAPTPVAKGQKWEIYSPKARRWAAAEVVGIDDQGNAHLKYVAIPESCEVNAADMLLFKDRFRRLP